MFIVLALVNDIEVYHIVIVSYAQGKVSVGCGLHFYIADRVLFVLNINVKAYAFGIVGKIHNLLPLRIFYPCDSYVKNFFKKPFASVGV